jgi:uncharacterized integral membrane protein
MIRYLRWLFLGLLALCLVTVAMANRAPVALRALPEDMSAFFGIGGSVELPLFLVIFGGIAAGLLIGFVWEWFREMKHRNVATSKLREVTRLERELATLRDAKGQPQDEVLAILDRKKAS